MASRREILQRAGLPVSIPVPTGILFVDEQPGEAELLRVYGTTDVVPYLYTLKRAGGRTSGRVSIFIPAVIALSTPQVIGAWIKRNSARVTANNRRAGQLRARYNTIQRQEDPRPEPSPPPPLPSPPRVQAESSTASVSGYLGPNTVDLGVQGRYHQFNEGEPAREGRIRGRRNPRMLREYSKDQYLNTLKPHLKQYKRGREQPQTTIKRLLDQAQREVHRVSNLISAWGNSKMAELEQFPQGRLSEFAATLDMHEVLGDALKTLRAKLRPIARFTAPLDTVGAGITEEVQLNHRIQTLLGAVVIDSLKPLLRAMLNRAQQSERVVIPSFSPEGVGNERHYNINEAFLANIDILNPFHALRQSLSNKRTPAWKVGADFYNSLMANPFSRLEEYGSDSIINPLQAAPTPAADASFKFKLMYRTPAHQELSRRAGRRLRRERELENRAQNVAMRNAILNARREEVAELLQAKNHAKAIVAERREELTQAKRDLRAGNTTRERVREIEADLAEARAEFLRLSAMYRAAAKSVRQSHTARNRTGGQRSCPYIVQLRGFECMSQYQVYSEPEFYGDKREIEEAYKRCKRPCFIHCCVESGIFTWDELKVIAHKFPLDFIPRSQWPKLSAALGFNVSIRFHHGHREEHLQGGVTRTLYLYEADDHVIIDEPVPFTRAALSNYSEAWKTAGRLDVVKRDGQWVVADESQWLRSGDVVSWLRANGVSDGTPIAGFDPSLHPRVRYVRYGKESKQNPLVYAVPDRLDTSGVVTARGCTRPFKPIMSQNSSIRTGLFFADFESTTDGERHQPITFCMVGTKPGERWEHYEMPNAPIEAWTDALSTILGEASDTIMPPEGVSDDGNVKAIVYVYFHNLTYDSDFLRRALGRYATGALVECGSRQFGMRIANGPVVYAFRCSMAHIPPALSKFGKMFDLEQEKELCPYELYSEANIAGFVGTFDKHRRQTDSGQPIPTRNRFCPLSQFLEAMRPESKRSELEKRVRRMDAERKWLRTINGIEHIDAYGYNLYYCVRDCEVLRDGFLKYREAVEKVMNLDVTLFHTGPSLSYANLQQDKVFEGCMEVSGPVYEFMREGVYGGRCMCRRNEKQHVVMDPNDPMLSGGIQDYDAVSLYPSAMHKLWTVRGSPKKLPESMTMTDLFNAYTQGHINDFIVRVNVTAVPKHLDFPLICHRFISGGQKKSVYLNEPIEGMICTNLGVENLMLFHEVPLEAFELIEGYYYTEGRNYTIRTAIEKLFKNRKSYKDAGNKAMSDVCKMGMNSCYGKSIMRPRYTKRSVMGEEDFFSRVQNGMTVCADEVIEGTTNHIVTTIEPVCEMSGFPLFGVQILEMSKRIMSEVMVLAQDLGIPIYYTDTDSMHIPTNGIPILEAAFLEKYGRPLAGKEMGQFHSDFEVSGMDGNWVSTEFIAVGKKAYFDSLVDVYGRAPPQPFFRMKGVPDEALRVHCGCDKLENPQWVGALREFYLRLYAGEAETIDILARMDGTHKVSFIRDNWVTKTRQGEFTRTVRFGDTCYDLTREDIEGLGIIDEDEEGDWAEEDDIEWE